MLPIRETIATEQIYDVRKAQRFYWSRYFGVYAGLNFCGCEEERGGDEDHLQPCRRCIECFGRARKTRQDKTGEPCLGCIECSRKARLWKTRQIRWRKHSTLHLARRDPRLEPVECHTLGMQFAIAWEALEPKVTSRMPRARIATNTLPEPAQSKYTRTCARSTLCENLVVKCRGPLTPRNTWCENLQEKCRRQECCVPACRIIMHGDVGAFSTLCQNSRKSAAKRDQGDRTIREPAQAKCTWTLRKKHLKRKLKGKMPQTKASERTGLGLLWLEMTLNCLMTGCPCEGVSKFTADIAAALPMSKLHPETGTEP